jgi:hypothetical protein
MACGFFFLWKVFGTRGSIRQEHEFRTMTDQEKKLHRAKLLIEIEDAERDLAFSQDQAIALAERLEKIADKLRGNAELQPNPLDFSPEGDVANRLTPDQISEFPVLQMVAAVVEELKRSRQTVLNLRKRMDKLTAAAIF